MELDLEARLCANCGHPGYEHWVRGGHPPFPGSCPGRSPYPDIDSPSHDSDLVAWFAERGTGFRLA